MTTLRMIKARDLTYGLNVYGKGDHIVLSIKTDGFKGIFVEFSDGSVESYPSEYPLYIVVPS